MHIWIIVGLILWILCVSGFLLAFHEVHRVHGYRYEQKLDSRNRDKPLKKVEDSIKEEVKKTIRTERSLGTRRDRCLPISKIISGNNKEIL